MSSLQLSLFDEKELLPSGTKIKELEEYIGTKVDAVDASAYYVGHKKGTVSFIEATVVNGYLSYRVELDNGEAFGFGGLEEIYNFFESNLKLTEIDFRLLCKNKKVCFVSSTDHQANMLYNRLKHMSYKFASISIEGIHLYRDECEFYSLDRTINYRGYKIQRVSFLRDDFYQLTKETESSKVFHVIKNAELKTSCGKELDVHIDTQDISELASICGRCEKIFNQRKYF
jgi:hypothetical protein